MSEWLHLRLSASPELSERLRAWKASGLPLARWECGPCETDLGGLLFASSPLQVLKLSLSCGCCGAQGNGWGQAGLADTAAELARAERAAIERLREQGCLHLALLLETPPDAHQSSRRAAPSSGEPLPTRC